MFTFFSEIKLKKIEEKIKDTALLKFILLINVVFYIVCWLKSVWWMITML